jgi:hypothetical protein
MKSRRTVVLAALAAASLALTMSAASAPRPILKLALQRADVPATAKKAPLWSPSPRPIAADALAPLGVRGLQGADYAYTLPAGGSLSTPIGRVDKEWHLTGDVYRAPNQAGAKRLFALGKAAGSGFFADFAGQPNDLGGLPSYGDEQIGRISTDSDGVHVMVFVRKGAIVWEMRVEPIPRQFRATKTQVTAVLKAYAPKQKARAGNG